MTKVIKFDKDKARGVFFKNRPKESKGLETLSVDEVMIKKIIEMYEDTANDVIADILGIKYSDLNLIIAMLRKRGFMLSKYSKITKKQSIDDAISKFAKRMRNSR